MFLIVFNISKHYYVEVCFPFYILQHAQRNQNRFKMIVTTPFFLHRFWIVQLTRFLRKFSDRVKICLMERTPNVKDKKKIICFPYIIPNFDAEGKYRKKSELTLD